ncbi:hypothetical protein A2943_02230 [Candidatus Adlerbacteria bacterium RIFCSPLOWO2_01_FULL_51_16]|uniref:Uncharacterized protein n=1 Tax=Candidatus Adlerbacteria bacterium RIFCSPLOWO2_01_FULL_51_16 TaxID=1797243 RepID=A0A1F4XG85_9BACT|nr:MAG: hypothetical protein A2943_02230 [Candidatus Adlerbacteria bacterium RIFCSPLOWO2_01_FULL_51_16]
MNEAVFLGLAAALFGAVIGSFLNALSFRFNTGRGMGGRSHCMHCNHELGALDLVPVFSYVYLWGRCRYCDARISLQYPLVEVAAAALALLTYLAHPEPLNFALWLVVWMTLLFTVVYDLRHGIIPWSCSGLLIVLALLYMLTNQPVTLLGALAGPLLALPLFLLSAVSQGRWMGWGDGVLELSLGWFLGLSSGATALMLAFWSGAIVGVGLLMFARVGRRKAMLQFTMRSEVPFAPFLVLGAFLGHFFHVNFFSSLFVLW